MKMLQEVFEIPIGRPLRLQFCLFAIVWLPALLFRGAQASGDQAVSRLEQLESVANQAVCAEDYPKAENVLREILKEQNSGRLAVEPEHRTEQSLAHVLMEQGKLQEAEEFFKKDLRTVENRHSPGGLYALSSIESLADVLLSEKKYGEAADMCKRALNIELKGYRKYRRQRVVWYFAKGAITVSKKYATALRCIGREADAHEIEARTKQIQAECAELRENINDGQHRAPPLDALE